jgi:hypothetical protein
VNPLSDTPLRLHALDEDDLRVISAHLQDAVVRVADMTYLPHQQTFAAVLNRFDWPSAVTDSGNLRRCRCGLRFERVLRAQVQGIRPSPECKEVAALLAVTYEPTTPPGGLITFHFCGGGAVRLEVECIEAELKDLGAVWQTRVMPKHEAVDVHAEGLPQQFDKAS